MPVRMVNPPVQPPSLIKVAHMAVMAGMYKSESGLAKLPNAEAEAAVRLGWVDLPEESSSLLGPIAALRAEMLSAGVDRFVLCGMGGSSLAPEVICAAAGVDPHLHGAKASRNCT